MCPMTAETHGAYCPSSANVETEARGGTDSDASRIRTGKSSRHIRKNWSRSARCRFSCAPAWLLDLKAQR